jgi:hypothetical protein
MKSGLYPDDQLALAALDKIAAKRVDASGVAVSERFRNDVIARQPKTNGCNDHEHHDGQIFLHTNDGATPRLYGDSPREPSRQCGFVARTAAPMNKPASNHKHTIEKKLREA